jgi:endonuclease/exonuclease/phosphatase family metal-dependent hydrolase
VKRLVLAVILLLSLLWPLGARDITILTYNVENLFDDVHNGSEFPEFDPARGGWNTDLFHMRVETIAEVIRKAVPGGPDVLLLQEVENENTLRALLATGLPDLGYDSFVIVPKKKLAANVAIASRFPISHVRSNAVHAWKKNPVRDVIEAEIATPAGVLHLFDDHWKSKAGGARATERSRLESAGIVAFRMKEILAADPGARVVVAGDMNENFDEFARVGGSYQTALVPASAKTPASWISSSLFLADGAGRAAGKDVPGVDASGRVILYEPWFELTPGQRGSYFYQGEWETMDHILLSAGLLDSRGLHYVKGSFRVLRLPFLLRPDGTPRKWTRAQRERGYSDHLPLLITLAGSN